MRREKLLVSAGATVIILLVLYSIFGYVRTEFQKRTVLANKIQEDIRARQAEIRQGKLSLRTLCALESRALPAAQFVDQSHTRYQQWLLDGVNRCGLAEAYVQSIGRVAKTNGSFVLTYRLFAKGTLQQCLAWWQEFYAIERLHLLRNVMLTPIEGTRQLKIESTVEVFAMVAATDRDVADVPRRGEKTLREFAELIVARNIFSPPNHPPTLDLPTTADLDSGAMLTLQAAAKDPDSGDTLRYDLLDPPKDATIDGTTGQIKWQAPQEGQFDLTVRVQDDGHPPLEASRKVAISVQAATAKRPSQVALDDAKQAFFCGMTSDNEEIQAWLQVRTTGVLHLLKAGDALKVGSVSATVSKINARDMELLMGDRRVTIRLGESLANVSSE